MFSDSDIQSTKATANEQNFLAHKRMLEKAYGLEDHVKRDILYDLAYQYGKSYGWMEIENYYEELSELLTDV